MIDISTVWDGTFTNGAAQGILASAAITAGTSTNIIDLMALTDIGAGTANDQEMHVDITAAFNAAGIGTLQIKLQGSIDNITYNDLLLSPVITAASLQAQLPGTPIFRYAVPVNQLNMGNRDKPPRYLQLAYLGGPFTANTGRLFAYLNLDREERIIYPANYNAAA